MRSLRQINIMVEKGTRWRRGLSAVSILMFVGILCLVVGYGLLVSKLLPDWLGASSVVVFVIALALILLTDLIDPTRKFTLAEKLVLRIDTLLNEANKYRELSGKERVASGKRLTEKARSIDQWLDTEYTPTQHDIFQEDSQMFVADLRKITTGIRQCVAEDTNIPPNVVSHLYNVLSYKEHLTKRYEEGYIQSFLRKAMKAFEDKGISLTPEPEKPWVDRLKDWLTMTRGTLAAQVLGLSSWGLLGGVFLWPSEKGAYFLGFLTVWLFIDEYLKRLKRGRGT